MNNIDSEPSNIKKSNKSIYSAKYDGVFSNKDIHFFKEYLEVIGDLSVQSNQSLLKGVREKGQLTFYATKEAIEFLKKLNPQLSDIELITELPLT